MILAVRYVSQLLIQSVLGLECKSVAYRGRVSPRSWQGAGQQIVLQREGSRLHCNAIYRLQFAKVTAAAI